MYGVLLLKKTYSYTTVKSQLSDMCIGYAPFIFGPFVCFYSYRNLCHRAVIFLF